MVQDSNLKYKQHHHLLFMKMVYSHYLWLFYKDSMNPELANTESLLLGEI